MEEKRIFRVHPGVLGIIVSILLILSRFMVNSQIVALESLNTVVVIVMLLLCVHLVRATSVRRQPHVWNAWDTLILGLMPLVMLVITLVQLIMEPPAFITSRVFSALLILVSVPVFLSCYFLYVSARLPHNKTLRVFSRLLLCAGSVYVLLRMLDAVILPIIEEFSEKTVAPAVYAVTGSNTGISFMMGVLSLAGFILILNEHDPSVSEDAETDG